jgi:hypothetical protein
MQDSRRILATAMLALAIGCASGGASGGTAPGPRQNSNLISTEEITDAAAANAYDLIQRLRPNFLRTRGAVHGTPNGTTNKIEYVDLVVYLNENRLGGTDQLRQISTSDIREIRYFSASEATTKWGTGHSAGAIQIVSR